MLLAGFPVGAKGKRGETALHGASWKGCAEIVKLLLKEKPPLEALDGVYKATPLVWALHGSVNSRNQHGGPQNPAADYPGVVKALLEAGVEWPKSVDEDLPEELKRVLAGPKATRC